MRLEFDRPTQMRSLFAIALAAVLSAALFWYSLEYELGWRRRVGAGLAGVCAWLLALAFANWLWLIVVGAPAAVITDKGIKFASLLRPLVPWRRLTMIERTFLGTDNNRVECVEIHYDGTGSVRRFPLSSLNGTYAEIDAWLAEARRRMKRAHAQTA